MTHCIITRALILRGIELCRVSQIHPNANHVAYALHYHLIANEGETPLATSLKLGYLDVYIAGELDALQTEKPRA